MHISRSAMMLGLGDACGDALSTAETFERLAQKPDKKEETRRNAASNATYWRGVYQDCLLKQELQALPSPASAPSGAEGVPGPGAGHPPQATPGSWSPLAKALMGGGALVGIALVAWMFMRRR